MYMGSHTNAKNRKPLHFFVCTYIMAYTCWRNYITKQLNTLSLAGPWRIQITKMASNRINLIEMVKYPLKLKSMYLIWKFTDGKVLNQFGEFTTFKLRQWCTHALVCYHQKAHSRVMHILVQNTVFPIWHDKDATKSLSTSYLQYFSHNCDF